MPALRENIRKDNDGKLHIPLGRPVLSLGVEDVREEEDLIRWADVLEPWIEIDRINIVSRRAKIHWVHWPVDVHTNQCVPLMSMPLEVGFYWNVQNLLTTRTNSLRSITLFRLEIARLIKGNAEQDFVSPDQLTSLNRTLEAF